jgi:hypothetical protein
MYTWSFCSGVSLTIAPLLSLGADQSQKIRQNALLNGGPFHAYHLDKLQCPQAQELLSKHPFLPPAETVITVLLLLSPQAIVN